MNGDTHCVQNIVLLCLTLICFLQIPPAPPKPDFDVSREKLQKLGEGNKR